MVCTYMCISITTTFPSSKLFLLTTDASTLDCRSYVSVVDNLSSLQQLPVDICILARQRSRFPTFLKHKRPKLHIFLLNAQSTKQSMIFHIVETYLISTPQTHKTTDANPPHL
ncbi:hypothetical protein OCU04_001515 [Sclerotinia nivalis]|uniref:Uncharacterized protein n=1 Tax=Sclerotinia nivalis TaxID=352851 RepID=A0A9X0DPH7_9HELO|nr:hypothetical protein OCU04_001515 [Sclerotinia nivalis]